MSEGWISLHRKIQDNVIWNSEPFSRGQAWVDLILLANHKPGIIYVRDHKIEVKRGQVGWSENRLSQRWQWSRTKVRKFLKDLEKEQQIRQEKSKSYSIITIEKYDEYQKEKQEKEQQKDNSSTTERQQKDTNNNDNNDNNDNNNILTTDVDEVPNASDVETWESAKRVAEYLLEAICETDPTHKYAKNPPSLNGWVKEIDRAIRLDGRTEDQFRFLIDAVFRNCHEFSDLWHKWHMNIESGKKLRDQFDKIKNQIISSRNGNPKKPTKGDLHAQALRSL